MKNQKEQSIFPEGTNIKTAVDVAVFNNKGEVLLGLRSTEAGFGQWGFPGGHLTDEEKIKECAERELKEELGNNIKIEITDEVLAVRENRIPPHYVPHITVILKGLHKGGIPEIKEPEKCREWKFIDSSKLHYYPLFSGVYETIINYFNKKTLVVTDWHEPKK